MLNRARCVFCFTPNPSFQTCPTHACVRCIVSANLSSEPFPLAALSGSKTIYFATVTQLSKSLFQAKTLLDDVKRTGLNPVMYAWTEVAAGEWVSSRGAGVGASMTTVRPSDTSVCTLYRAEKLVCQVCVSCSCSF